MTTIRPCSVDEIAEAALLPALLRGYASESSIPELGDPSADLAMYKMMEAHGSFKAIGVFAPHLVGLATLLIYGLPHYGGRKVATMESFYVMPEHRPGGAGKSLLRAAEDLAFGIGANVLMVSAPIGKRLEKILPRSGYRATNTVFLKAAA